jgi:predicted PurR-regulated permease PerM
MSTSSHPFYVRLSLQLLAIFLLGLLIYIGSGILMPLFFAIILAVLLLPVVNWLNKKGINNVVSMILAILLALLVIGGILYFLSSQVAGFMSDLPAIKEKLNEHISTMQKWISDQFNINREQQLKAVDSAKQSMQQSGSGGIGTAVLSIGSGLFMIILLPIYTFLVLYYRKLIHRFLLDVFTPGQRGKVEEVITESRSIVQGYMVGLMLELLIVTILNSVGFFVIGVEYAIFLAVLAAVLNMIPYIGMLVASVLCMAVTLTTSDDLSTVVWVGVILVVVQFIDNNFIMPYIVSSKVRINALVSIIGVLVGGALAGVAGMFLSIPGVAVLKSIFERVDSLKPWGELLGDDQSSLKTKSRRKKER